MVNTDIYIVHLWEEWLNETWDDKASFTDNLWDGGHTLIFIATTRGVTRQKIKMKHFILSLLLALVLA